MATRTWPLALRTLVTSTVTRAARAAGPSPMASSSASVSGAPRGLVDEVARRPRPRWLGDNPDISPRLKRSYIERGFRARRARGKLAASTRRASARRKGGWLGAARLLFAGAVTAARKRRGVETSMAGRDDELIDIIAE